MFHKVLAQVLPEADTKAGVQLARVLLRETSVKDKGEESEAGGRRPSFHNARLTPMKGDRDCARRALECMQHSSKKVSARLLKRPHAEAARERSPASQANGSPLTPSLCSLCLTGNSLGEVGPQRKPST